MAFLFALLAGVLQIEIVHAHHFCHLASTGRIISPPHVTKSAGNMIGLRRQPYLRRGQHVYSRSGLTRHLVEAPSHGVAGISPLKLLAHGGHRE
jgi:hypothetical protein